jgi:hypothetical protein
MIYLQTYIPAQPPPHPPPVASLSLLCFLEVANRRPWKAGENCVVILITEVSGVHVMYVAQGSRQYVMCIYYALRYVRERSEATRPNAVSANTPLEHNCFSSI